MLSKTKTPDTKYGLDKTLKGTHGLRLKNRKVFLLIRFKDQTL